MGCVFAIAVRCGRSRLRGKSDHRVRTGRFDLGKPASDRPRTYGPFHGLGERVIAARIENDEIAWPVRQQPARGPA